MCEFKSIAINGDRACYNCQHMAKTCCGIKDRSEKTDLVHEHTPIYRPAGSRVTGVLK